MSTRTSKEVMLTTIDNPFNPFTQFDEWFAFDVSKGYNSSAFLARVLVDSSELGEQAEDRAIEEAIDEICRYNILGIYKKVDRSTKYPLNMSTEDDDDAT